MGNIVDGRVNFLNLKQLDKQSKDLPILLLKHDDILFNRTNSLELVGKAGIYDGEDNVATFASYLIRIRVLGYANAKYLNYYLMSPFFRDQIS